MDRPVPSLLGPYRVVLRGGYARRANGGFVGKGMVGEVAVEFKIYLGGAQVDLQLVHRVDFEKLILGGPVTLNRHADFACVQVVQRWASVPDHAGVDLRGLGERK